jgi:hypothetical protein
MQKIVLQMTSAFPPDSGVNKDKWIDISSKFKYLLGQSFPESQNTVLIAASPAKVKLTILAGKLSKYRPEVYLAFQNDTGEYNILDEAMFDAYADHVFEKPDWSAFWPLI